jgi:Uri superfamily endonuclease
VIQIPPHPGVYALQLSIDESLSLHVGRLRSAYFPAGEYVYLGSACGPGGLQARLGRHLSRKFTRPHWHIDYLRPVTTLRAYCYLETEPSTVSPKPLECLWSQALLKLPDASAPVRGFGSSDCRSGCRAHLVVLGEGTTYFGTKNILEALAMAAGRSRGDLVYVKII